MAINFIWIICLALGFYLLMGILCVALGYFIFYLARYFRSYVAVGKEKRRIKARMNRIYPHARPLRL